MPEVRVNGVWLYYEEHGSGDSIVGLHGAGSSAAFWSDAAPELATRGRTIVYDRRGHFRSERPEPYATNVHEQADDAAALVDALAAAPAIVIGRSYGGAIAIDLALRYPDLVRALVQLEGDGGLSLSGTAMRELVELSEPVFAAADADMSTVGETLIRRALGDEAWEDFPDEAKEIFTGNGPAIVAELRGGFPDVTVEQLATIDLPTLLVGARDSRVRLCGGDRHRGDRNAVGQGRVGRGRSCHQPRPPGRAQVHRRSARPPVAPRGLAGLLGDQPSAAARAWITAA